MNALHEAMEVDTLLFREWNEVKKRVHQEALAAAHRAPQVDAGHPLWTRPEPQPRAAIFLQRIQLLMQALKRGQRPQLRRVERETVALRDLLELTEQACG